MGRALAWFLAGMALALGLAGCVGPADEGAWQGRTSRNARDGAPLIQFLPEGPPVATFLLRERGHVASAVDGKLQWSEWSEDEAPLVFYGARQVQDAFGRSRDSFLFRYDVTAPSAAEGHVTLPFLYWVDSDSGEFVVRRDLVHGDWHFAWDDGGGVLAPSYVGAILAYLLLDGRLDGLRSADGVSLGQSTYRLAPSDEPASGAKGCSAESLDWVGPVARSINVTVCLSERSGLPLRVRAWHDRLTYTADFVGHGGPVPHATGAGPVAVPAAPTRGWLTTFGSGVPYSVTVPPVSAAGATPEYGREYTEAATRGYNFASFHATRTGLYLARLQFNSGPISQTVPYPETMFRSNVYISDGSASFYTFVDKVEAQDQRAYASTSSGSVSTVSPYGAGVDASTLPHQVVPLEALNHVQQTPLPAATRWIWSVGRAEQAGTPAHAWWAVSEDCLSDDQAQYAVLSAVNGQRLVEGPAVPALGTSCRLRTP